MRVDDSIEILFYMAINPAEISSRVKTAERKGFSFGVGENESGDISFFIIKKNKKILAGGKRTVVISSWPLYEEMVDCENLYTLLFGVSTVG